ncbi:MAG: peptide ABC transporter permease [Bdellovibrio sp. CG10_big_fil_rev_8_21_14_0_10_47_8]|nr:MAG: peptide ABC transporter permease [Bdellovibrio sp. CG10_big_fil_rev_8_21_14_0_10_47_8]
MIEKYLIRNNLTLKRYRKFKKHRLAIVSLFLLGVITFFSFTAEFWANSKPLVMKYRGEIYVPVLRSYYPTVFGQQDTFVTNYRALEFGPEDWVAWPLIQWDAFESNSFVADYPAPPSRMNWLGTDDRGRDVLTRLLYGFRYSIGYAFSAWLLSYLLGGLIGAFQGYMGGRVDLVGSRFVELIEMMPQLLLLITIISIFEPSMALLVIFTVLFDWTGIYHHMRAQFLQLRKREYVEAARAIGASHFRIITKHILPNALTPLVTFSPFAIAANISGLALLDYLGLGLHAPTPSWGELIGQSQKYFSIAEWLVWWPSIFLLVMMICLINIGLAIREAYDSR